MLDTKTLDNRFKNLFKSGNLVQVHVSKWSMSTSVQPEDLGLETTKKEDSKIPDFVTLGKKTLFTDDVRLKFGRIESSARAYLAANSHKFPVADAHFVPVKILPVVLATLGNFKTAYLKEVEDLITNYEKYKQKMFDAYPDHKSMLEPFYLGVDQIRPKFGFDWSAFEVSFPKNLKSLSMADVKAQNIAVDAATRKYEVQLKEQYDQHLKQIEEFAQTSALALRSKIIETFEVIAQKIQGNEVVNATNLKTLKAVIDNFDALDFLDDEKVKTSLATVKKLVNCGADFKDDKAALARLSAALNTTLETAKNMSDIDEITGGYIRKLDIGDL